MQETLHFTAWHRLLPTDSAIRSADDSETVRFYLENSCSEAAPPNAVVARVLTTCPIGAQEMPFNIKSTQAPRVGELVLAGQGIAHVQGSKPSEPERWPHASFELLLPSHNDLEVAEVGVLKDDSAEVAEVLPDVALNHFAAAGTFDKAFFKGGIPAEGRVGATLDHSLQPVDKSMVVGGLASSKEEFHLSEIRDLSCFTSFGNN